MTGRWWTRSICAQAAGKLGLRTIGVLCGGFPEAELRAAGGIAIYRDPAELLAHYETSPLAQSSDNTQEARSQK